MFDIVGKRYIYFLISLVVIVPGLIFMGLFWAQHPAEGPLSLAIDFTGGALLEVSFVDAQAFQTAEVKSYLVANAGLAESATVQTVEDHGLLIKTEALTEDQKLKITSVLVEKYGALDTTKQRFESVGPSVGREVTTAASLAVLAASLGILIYIGIAFRHMPHPFRYGLCAIIAMLHDVLVVVGSASILGYFFGWQVDSLFLTALLTVIGFSVHDTIVVFDRIRENLARHRGDPFEDIVNHSIVQTLARSINTQLTVMLTLLALVLFGGESVRHFVLTLLIGVLSGTYSSIFNAAPLLVVWENQEFGDFMGNLFRGRAQNAEKAAA